MHARADDDAQTLSALSFNMASQQLQEAQVAAIFSDNDADLVRQAGAAILATESFDDWIGTVALTSLSPILRGGVAVLKGAYREALDLFGTNFDKVEAEGLDRHIALLLADRAWCRFKLGDAKAAAADAEAAVSRIAEDMEADDKALTHGRLAQLYAGLGQGRRSEEHRGRAHDALGRYRAAQAEALQAAIRLGFVETEALEAAAH